MKTNSFSKQDERQAKKRGISVAEMTKQMSRFKKGFSFVRLTSPCVVNKGIIKLSPQEQNRAEKHFLAVAWQKKSVKFVPASGAASRMFLFLEDAKPEYNDLKKLFLKRLPDFAFYSELAKAIKKKGLDIMKLRRAKDLKPIVEALLEEDGLDYRQAPKGMILFHREGKKARTGFEEQLSEGILFADKKGRAQLHFTLPSQSRMEVRNHLKIAARGARHSFLLSDSIQSPATDCLAMEKSGEPVRTDKRQLLFRPAGHGALLSNLNHIKKAGFIYVKNIDNILPTANRKESDQWKRILCGVFLETQEKTFKAQKILEKKKMMPEEALFVIQLAAKLGWKAPSSFSQRLGGSPNRHKGRESLSHFFHRPLRVCGMVPKTGEPGGGPFWTKNRYGNITPQIVESAEVNFKSKQQETIWRSSTHFNPVEFVCGTYDAHGKKFNLMEFADAERGLIAKKNYQGREIRVMELPGLWNGGMANWITVFIEISVSAFAPVKTALDLLRPEHQPRKMKVNQAATIKGIKK